MDNTHIYIPKRINVGFRKRNDTYTGKLAYVICYDEKGKLRKETSWNNWRDDKIPNEEYDNTPMEGFVLNKKAGDCNSGWNHRHAYCRVYDPRGFEFEITIENLLYILENTNSIKGKGLEGEFVYGWSGKDLVLMPTESVDYKQLSDYNELLHTKNTVKVKDLRVGATYITKQNSHVVYMGRFPYYTDSIDFLDMHSGETGYVNSIHLITSMIHDENKRIKYQASGTFVDNRHFFCVVNDKNYDFIAMKSLSGKIIGCTDANCSPLYDSMYEALQHSSMFSPVDLDKTVLKPISKDEFLQILNNIKYVEHMYSDTGIQYRISKAYRCEDKQSNKEQLYSVNQGWDDYYTNDTYEDEAVINDIKKRFRTKDVKGRTYLCRSHKHCNSTIKIEDMTADELYDRLKPCHKEIYLSNGCLKEVL